MVQIRTFLTALFVLLTAVTATAGVYRVVDDNGNVTFTDTPPADQDTAETVDLPVINTQPAPVLSTKPSDSAEQTETATGYSQVTITSPVNDSTVTPGQLTVNVQLTTEPALQPGHSIQFYYDNQPYGKPTVATNFQIGGMERGQHSVQAKILDDTGTILATSSSVTFHVKRSFIRR